jgi:hypothetical protein
MDELDQKFAEEHRKEWDTINRAKSEPLIADE